MYETCKHIHYIYIYIVYILFIFTSNLYCTPSASNDNFYKTDSCLKSDGITDINDIVFEDYSINLTAIGFPMLSTFLMIQSKLPILSIFLDLYEFIGYSKNVSTEITYLNFFRTLKTIYWHFLDDNKSISVSFTYSSSMNVNYNSMIRDLSASYSKIYTDTNILLGIHFYF
ncbi:hypothetical protein [uncultured Brachyspira sp.]|uniref:hypothetical protein n=1 Tax=uncultured Brachyspira sp. TaxID=221953 RepID=UPI0025F1CF27|nr:hypothetical protein [uncultured Brachyspira sp.]